jgi:putative ABC transport system permease protein
MPEDRLMPMFGLTVDQDFLHTYGIPLLKGRNYSERDAGDREEAFILNEAAVRALGWENPIGKRLSRGIPGGKIIGVVPDFHFRSLHERIEPLFLFFSRSRFQYLSVRVRPGNAPETIALLEKRWKELAPEAPFEYFVLNDKFDQLHRDDARAEKMYGSFALLAAGIACFGLFGLTVFMAGQRSREIGIRKVLGATTGEILLMLSGEFIRLLALAQIIAWPAAYFAMRFWLGNFAYHTRIPVSSFLIGSLISLTVALLAVSFQITGAAKTSPAETLRYE